jgi:hypothetical protein
MYIETIPTNILIAPDNILGGVSGDNVCAPINELTVGHKRILLNLNYGGSIFGRGNASAVFYEPDETSMLANPSSGSGFASGLWIIEVNNHTRFIGYMTGMDSQRSRGGSIRTYTFTDVLQGWDVLLTNTIYPVSTDPTYTVHSLLNDIVYSAKIISGIENNGPVPANNMLLNDLYEEGVYSITNSTYLAEIQKICQDLGYIVFCDTGFGKVTILDPFNPDRGYLDIDEDSIIDASYSIDYLAMASTVLVNDDITLKGVAYGHLGTGANRDDLVYNFSRINNLVFATTFGVKEAKLAGIAEQLYKIGKNQSRILTLTKAGDEYSSLCLGSKITWVGGDYTIFEYETTISRTEYKTVLKGFVSL